MPVPKRPKTLYFYENKQLCKHKVTPECMVEVVGDPNIFTTTTRFRCRVRDGSNYHDHYGFGSINDAKMYEIEQTKLNISTEQAWLAKLESSLHKGE